MCEEKIIPELDIAAAGFVKPEIVGLIARAVVSQFEEERLLSFQFRESLFFLLLLLLLLLLLANLFFSGRTLLVFLLQ